jgi:TRAP-type mannitol/chloroaromatic compound transport system permease small subunit
MTELSAAGTPPNNHAAIIVAARMFGWVMLTLTGAFIVSNYFTFWQGWPGVPTLFGDLGLFGVSAPKKDYSATQAWLQLLVYGVAVVLPIIWTKMSPARSLRSDAEAIMAIAVYLIRASFWAILFIGLADMVISFLRVEGVLAAAVGQDLAQELGRSRFRGAVVHMPLFAAGAIVAAIMRSSLGFHWLATLVVIAELFIVISRFVFSYEQAFQGDLVRFWYAGLFLFASAHTLFEDGHVRVDVLYAQFSSKTKGLVNAIGCVTLGLPMCWLILIIGFLGTSSIISGPLVNYEISQSGFGMYVKYLMAAFLGIFAITMMVQFISYFLESIADWLDQPGARIRSEASAH